MAKSDLPREVNRKPLDYGQLVSVLDLIEGECVIVRLTTGADRSSTAGVASLVGELHHVPARYEGDEFAVGSPYPDHNLEHPVGGVIFINEHDFEGASLSTWDGNDNFAIGIDTRFIKILVQDRDSTYP